MTSCLSCGGDIDSKSASGLVFEVLSMVFTNLASGGLRRVRLKYKLSEYGIFRVSQTWESLEYFSCRVAFSKKGDSVTRCKVIAGLDLKSHSFGTERPNP